MPSDPQNGPCDGEYLDADVDGLLNVLREGPDSANARRAAQLLIRLEDGSADAALLAFFGETRTDAPVAMMASRVLAERDPYRDPSYVLDWFSFRGKIPRMLTIFPMWKWAAYKFPITTMCGVSRLRRADPVRHYTHFLRSGGSGARFNAAAALGDTADVAALDALEHALTDRHWRVRRVAADSVRRLRHFGAAETLPTHGAYQRLVACLADTKDEVSVAAARALWSLGQEDPVHEALRSLPHRRRLLEPVTSGEIPPLGTVWAADETL